MFLFFFFFSDVSCVTVLCMMGSSTCKEQFRVVKAVSLPTSVPALPTSHGIIGITNLRPVVTSSIKWKEHNSMLEEKGTASPQVLKPLPAQIYDSLRNPEMGKLCGSFRIHLGKDDIHREVCDFFFSNFKLHLKWFLSFPPLVSPRMEETRDLMTSETAIMTANIILSSKTHTH